MSKISFLLRQTSKRNTEQSVYVRHSHKGSDFVKGTGVTVAPAYFDLKTGKVSNKLPLAPEWNDTIEQVRSDIQRAARNIGEENATKAAMAKEYARILERRAETKTKVLKAENDVNDMLSELRYKRDELKAELNDIENQIMALEDVFNSNGDNTIASHIKAYLKTDAGKKLREGSVEVYNNLSYNIEQWNSKFQLADITKLTFESFEAFLLAKKLRNLTVRSVMARLKTVVNYYSDKLSDKDSYKRYKAPAKKKSPTIIYLSKEELEQLENMPLTKPNEIIVRDIFVLLSHTGLRWSDRNINKDSISNGVATIIATKTGTEIKIPLSTKAKEILKTYSYKLPDISERTFSFVIKRICSRIDSLTDNVASVNYSGANVEVKYKPKYELIAAHSARRTFINLCLIAKTNPAVIRGWVGHNSLEMLMVYANKQANTKEELAAVFG